MKFSFDIPVNHMDTFYKYQDFLVCNLFYYLDIPAYSAFFRKKANEKHVILDTTSFNLARKVSMTDVITVADSIGAKEIVSPYFFFNAERTLDQLNMLYSYLDNKSLLEKFSIIVVPQGNTIQEYLRMLPKFLRFPSETIAINANVFSLENTYITEQLRFTLIQKITKNKLLGKKCIHLMELCGMQFLKAYKKGQKFFRIRSINTAYPFVSGIMGKDLGQSKKRFNVPDNFHNIPLSTKPTIERIKQNILFMKEYRA